MKHFVLWCLAWSAMVVAASAQTFEGFTDDGRFEVEIGGEAAVFLALTDTESGRSYVTARETAGFLSMNVAGQEVVGGDTPGNREISILIGPYPDDIPDEATLEVYGPDVILAANIDTGLKVRLSDVVIGDGMLSFAFEGEVVPAELDRAEGIMVAVEGAAPVAVSGTYSGIYPVVK